MTVTSRKPPAGAHRRRGSVTWTVGGHDCTGSHRTLRKERPAEDTMARTLGVERCDDR